MMAYLERDRETINSQRINTIYSHLRDLKLVAVFVSWIGPWVTSSSTAVGFIGTDSEFASDVLAGLFVENLVPVLDDCFPFWYAVPQQNEGKLSKVLSSLPRRIASTKSAWLVASVSSVSENVRGTSDDRWSTSPASDQPCELVSGRREEGAMANHSA
jgi:hypothetical protein